MTARWLLLACALLIGLTGCAVRIPPRWQQPERSYSPQVPAATIMGFNRLQYLETGRAGGYVAGQGFAGAAFATQGEYRPTSDAGALRWFLEETRCVRQVTEGGDSAVRIEGAADGRYVYGLHTAAIIVEAFTVTPLFGMPVPGKTEGNAVARLYRDGQYAKAYHATEHFDYWTTYYSWRRDQAQAIGVVRLMALRDLADEIAADLCGGGGTAR
jgi:hypothetical protein